MAEFLSPAWVVELDAALRALESGESGSDDRFVIEQRVIRPDGDDHTHHVVASGGRFRAIAGPAPDPDLVLTTDLETAIAIQRGAVNAQLALAAGHLRLGGDLEGLLARAELFAELDDVFAALRDATTSPSGSGPEGHH